MQARHEGVVRNGEIGLLRSATDQNGLSPEYRNPLARERPRFDFQDYSQSRPSPGRTITGFSGFEKWEPWDDLCTRHLNDSAPLAERACPGGQQDQPRKWHKLRMAFRRACSLVAQSIQCALYGSPARSVGSASPGKLSSHFRRDHSHAILAETLVIHPQ